MRDDELVGFDPDEWERQRLGQIEEPEEYRRWDYMWCRECRGFGFVKLAWYRGFEECPPYWTPCQRCNTRGYVRVYQEHALAYAFYTPTWADECEPMWLLDMMARGGYDPGAQRTPTPTEPTSPWEPGPA
jgi:hypothetical protein